VNADREKRQVSVAIGLIFVHAAPENLPGSVVTLRIKNKKVASVVF
jgi:hypothetical protein